MRGDYTRFSFDPRKRYDAVQQQQGRVQLDSDWNEAEAIQRRRIRTLGFDLFGPVGIGDETTPAAFLITPILGSPFDLGIAPGRLYVDGILAEGFTEDAATYLNQPFLPGPPALPTTGDAVVYLDVWDREVTWIQDNHLLDAALGGRDTTTRLQTVWQVKFASVPGAVCGLPVGAPASAGRLSSSAIAPPTPDDPCLLPPVAGYRGLENRLYRVEIHNGGPMGTARFKWSRDNGSIVSAVSDLTVAGGQTHLTINRLGRDAILGLAIGNWVTVTDDDRELAEEPGEMARIVDIQLATNGITLDRALPAGGTRPFGANPAELAARHTRVQRWDQTASTNTLDADGLIATATGLIGLEDGVQIDLTLDPVGGNFSTGDWWVFAARVATASVEELNKAPPRGNHHHYVQLAAVTGLGGAGPIVTDCRPKKPVVAAGAGCCTVVVAVGEDIQKAIDSLPGVGGCVCLKAGTHLIRKTLIIARSNMILEGESPGTTVLLRGDGPVLLVGGKSEFQRVEIHGIDFERIGVGGVPAVIGVTNMRAMRIASCATRANGNPEVFGIVINGCRDINVADCIVEGSGAGGIWVLGETTRQVSLTGNAMAFGDPTRGAPVQAFFGILSQKIWTGLLVADNDISGVFSGIVVNDTPGDVPNSGTNSVRILNNNIVCEFAGALAGAPVLYGIDLVADRSLAEGNSVRLPEGSDLHTGIRVAGQSTQASGNSVTGARTGGFSPFGIVAGYGGAAASVATANVRIANNVVQNCPIGIMASLVFEGWIEGNAVSLSEKGAFSVGIFQVGCLGMQIEFNEVVGLEVGVGCYTEIGSRVAGNVLSSGGLGVLLLQETGAAVADNRIALMTTGAIGGKSLLARTDMTSNQITNCALDGGGTAAIAVEGANGPLRIAGNEILDTGVSLSPPGNATPVYGIHAMLVREASVDGNQVSFTSPYNRNAAAEDRALLMQGLMELTYNTGNAVVVLGYPIQVTGNSFSGTGQSALVELRQTKVSDFLNQRFERVMFNNNYCEHVTAPALAKTAATVRLVGRAATVVGNQIKSQPHVASVDFGGMPGPFAANVIGDAGVNHGNVPAPDAVLNVTI